MKQNQLLNIALGLALTFGSAVPTRAQDLLQYLDLNSDEFTKSDMTRAEIEAVIAAAGAGVVDLFGKRLNGLDLSGLDLRKTSLKSAYINGTNFTGANLDGAVLDRAWALKSNFTKATFKGASLLEAEMMDAKFDGADFSGARLAANMSRASFVNVRFDGANLSRYGRMQAFRAVSRRPSSTVPRSRAQTWHALCLSLPRCAMSTSKEPTFRDVRLQAPI